MTGSDGCAKPNILVLAALPTGVQKKQKLNTMNKQMKFVFFLPIQIKMQLLREIVHPKLKRREKIRTELFLFLN